MGDRDDLVGAPREVVVDVSAHDDAVVPGTPSALLVQVCAGDRPVGQFLLDDPASRAGGGGLRTSDLRRLARARYATRLRHLEEVRRLEEALGAGQDRFPRLPVTVVVCTRDRPSQLRGCLDALARLSPAPAEVIVVDNGSRPADTAEAVGTFGFRFVREPRPGLDRARNRALVLVRTPIVAFTDDDCRPWPGWLAGLDRHFANTGVDAVTGIGLAAGVRDEAQLTFERHGFVRDFEEVVADWTSLDVMRAGSMGAGACMAFRTAVLVELGGFPEDLDAGTPARSGGDTWVLTRVLAAGGRIVRDPSMVVAHEHRADHREVRRVMRGYGVGTGAVALRALVAAREPGALSLWALPLRLLVWALRARMRGAAPGELRLPAEMLAGAAAALLLWPLSLLRAIRRAASPNPRQSTAPPPPSLRASEPAPAVSVVIPTLQGRGDRLARAVAAANRQDVPRWRYEVLVVENGIDEDDPPPAAGVDRMIRLRSAGAAGARNAGAREARAPVLVFADDDVELAPGALSAHLAALTGPDVISLGPCWPPRSKRLVTQVTALWWRDHYWRKSRHSHVWTFRDVTAGNMALPAALFASLGGFDERFGAARREDWEFGIRAIRAGARLRATSGAEAAHRYRLDTPTFLAHCRADGRGDAVLCAAYPEAAYSLPVGEPAVVAPDPAHRLAIWVVRRRAGRRAVLATLALLEAARLRRTWFRLLGGAVYAEYRIGLASAGIRPTARVRPPPLVVDLADPQVPRAVAVLGPLVVRDGERELARVELRDGIWDAYALARRAAAVVLGGP